MISSLQVRKRKTRWSSGSAARRSATETNGPYSFAPFASGLRVISTRGKSSPVRTWRYGNVLSSRSLSLYRGWMSLISRFSRSRASTSLSQASTSRSVTSSEIMWAISGPRVPSRSAAGWK